MLALDSSGEIVCTPSVPVVCPTPEGVQSRRSLIRLSLYRILSVPSIVDSSVLYRILSVPSIVDSPVSLSGYFRIHFPWPVRRQ